MKPQSLKQISAALIAGVLTLAFNTAAQAASGSWLATGTDNYWTDSTNWSAAFPNSTNQTATFNNPLQGGTGGGVGNPIDLTNGGVIAVQNILFTGSAGAYVIGTGTGNRLQLYNSAAGGNSISIDATGTSSEVIAAPIFFQAPSSTNGQYTFQNNSALTGATLVLSGSIQNNSSGTRPAGIILAGSNTGANTISGNIAFSGYTGTQLSPILTKNGTGTWILSGSNAFTSLAFTNVNGTGAGLQVNAGVLVIENNFALGTNATANANINNYINSGGTLELNSSGTNGSITLDNGLTLQLRSGGTIRSNGSNTTNSRINLAATAAGISATISTVNSSDVFIIGNGTNDFSGGLSDTVTHIAGPGTVKLAQSSNYAGIVSVDSGVLQMGSPTALGAATSGNVAFGAGSTGKLQLLGNSATIIGLNSNATVGAPIVENGLAGAVTLTVNNAVANTYAGVIQDGAAGTLAFTKGGNGILKLASANTYSGATNVTGGILSVTNGAGSATSTNTVTFSGTSGLTGNGTISGVINLTGTNSLTPGDAAIGTLTVGAVTLQASTTLNYEFGAGNDLLAVTTANGLGINGGGFNLYNAGGTSTFATSGTYNLITYNGAILGAGVTSLGVLNSVGGKTYTFGTSGGNTITLKIADVGIGTWINPGGGTYNSGTNWDIASIPSGQSASAILGNSIVAPSTVTLDFNQTLGNLTFNSLQAYTVSTGVPGGALIMDNGASNAAINIGQGNHTITAPVNLTSNTILTATGSLTVSGNISNTSAARTLTKNGNGGLVLLGSNSYGPGAGSIGTILNAGTITVANNSALGAGDLSVLGSSIFQAGAASLALANNVILAPGVSIAIDTNGNSFALNGAISGTSNTITLFNLGTLTLGGNNSLAPGTLINLNAGTLVAGSATALPAGVLLSMGGGTLDVNGNSVSANSFSGSGTVTNSSAVAGTDTLAVTQTGAATFSGTITDGTVRKLAFTLNSGTMTLSGSNGYTGATTVANGSVLNLPGGGVITGGGASSVNGQLVVAGGSFNAASLTVHNNQSIFLVSSGSANIAGAINQTDNGASNSSIQVTGNGSLTAASLSMGRTGLANNTQPAAGDLFDGYYQSGGTLNISGAVNIGITTSLSSGNFRMDGGVATIGGIITLGINNNRWSTLDVNGGRLISTEATTGIQLGAVTGSPTQFLVRSGTATVEKITMGQGNNANQSFLVVSGGSLYVGSGGIVKSSTNIALNSSANLSGGIVGAKADWSSAVNTAFISGTATIQAADASGVAHNITLNGVQSGVGALTKTGNGTLTLAGLNSMSGATSVNAGTLVATAYGSAQPATTAIATTGTNILTYTSLPAGITVGETITGAFGTLGTSAPTTITSINVGTNMVTTAANYTGPGGTDTFALSAWQSIGSGAATVSGTAILNVSSATVASLTLANSGTAVIAAHSPTGPAGVKVLQTSALSISGSTGAALDLTNNAGILYASGTAAQAANLAAVQAQALLGYNGGLWNGPGVTSSTAATDAQINGVLSVMVYDNTQIGLASFEGVSGLDTAGFNQVLLKTTYSGDFDASGTVDSLDYGLEDFYASISSTLGDLNGDGVVNSLDYGVLDYVSSNQAYGPLSIGGGGGVTPAAVPEPGSLGLLAVGAAAIFFLIRKKSPNPNNNY